MANISVLRRSKKTVATAKLVIENFSEEIKGAKPGESFDSGSFKAGDNHFRLRFYPDANNNKVLCAIENTSSLELEGKVQFLLKCEGEITRVMPMTNIPRPMKENERWGCLFKKCDETIPRGKDLMLVARLPGKMKKFEVRAISNSDSDERKRGPSTLEKVYNKMQDPDFQLICSHEQVPCHKVILAGASPVFEAMLGNKMNKEVIEAKLVMEEISAEIGRAFVQFIYTGEVEDRVLMKRAYQLLILGDKYQLPGLKELAEGEMIKQLDRDNMVKLFYKTNTNQETGKELFTL